MTNLDMKILIVDDYKTMIRIIRNLLRQIGYENIEDATDGVHGLEKLRAGKFDFVISDWSMEPMSGLQLLKEIRADASLAATPFLLVTAESKSEIVAMAKKAGVSGYIFKPFNAGTLKNKIDLIFA